MTMFWDSAYSTYAAKELVNFDNFKMAKNFCLQYCGDEQSIFIQKAYINK